VAVGCTAHGPAPEEDARLIDLSYTFDETTLYWPTDQPFFHREVTRGVTEGGYWYSSYQYGGSEHGGTHLDAPIHFAEGGRTVDAIPLEDLMAPGAVIDISGKCEQDRDYLLSVEDTVAHEREHGAIKQGMIVLVRTGWGKFWPDKKQYLGTDAPGDVQNLHFPGVSPEAAQALADRHVAIVGIDTASIDRGMSQDFQTHRVLGAANIAVLENVAHLEQVPATGFGVIALPMKISQGSGAPCRVVAMVEKVSP
jgi:kynurenine formamidase